MPPSILLKLVVYIFKLILLMFCNPSNIRQFYAICHINNKTTPPWYYSFVFPKNLILKRENNIDIGNHTKYDISAIWFFMSLSWLFKWHFLWISEQILSWMMDEFIHWPYPFSFSCQQLVKKYCHEWLKFGWKITW